MSSERGMTIVELMIVILILVPVLGLIATSSVVATRTLDANDVAASTTEKLQRTIQRLSHFVRPCVLSTYEVEATPDDVAAGRALAPGQWISPADGEARTAVRFRSALGDLSMNASSWTPQRTIRFELDPSETVNGVDDDGDGFVDEGRIVLDYDGTRVDMVIDAERCTFALDGRELTIAVAAASRSRSSRVVRAATTAVLHLRNN